MSENKEHSPKPSVRELFQESLRSVQPEDVLRADRGSTITEELAQARVRPAGQTGHLEDIEVEFVRTPDRGDDFDARHDDRLIIQQTVETLLSSDPEKIKTFREKVMTEGGFLLKYLGRGVGRDRLQHRYESDRPKTAGWLMAEGSAIPVTSTGRGSRVVGADAQVYIPADEDNALSEEHPMPDRILEGEAIYREIVQNPACAAVIADIVAVREYQRFSFASATEDGVMRRISENINQSRERVIKYLLAAMVSIKGVHDKNGRPLSTIFDPGFRNLRSLLLHTSRTGRADGLILGKQTGKEIPIELPGGDYGKLLTDWFVTAQPLEHAKPRSDIILRDEVA